VQKITAGNTIVSLPTGAGKTLVAVLSIDFFLSRPGAKKVMFVVPTTVLVKQQAQYCRDRCETRRSVAELSGTKMDAWTQQEWSRCLQDNVVLVGTPEVFRRALVDCGFIQVLDFSLIIFDECHNATGNSPMAGIMRDAVWKVASQRDCPRILGLTASFVNGALKNVEQKRKDLETLLQSSLFCPDVPEEFAAGGAAGSLSKEKFQTVNWLDDIPANCAELVSAKLTTLLDRFQAAYRMPVKDLKKTVNQTRHVFEELGMTAFCCALRDCIVPQLEAHAETLDAMGGSSQQKEVLKQQLPQLRRQMQEAADTLRDDGQLTQTPLISGKAAALLQLLETLFQGEDGRGDFRGIVFVTQVALTMPLAHLLTEHFGKNQAVVRAGAVSGTQSMADAKRDHEMERFRKGELNVLICTSALEEGVDVSDCAFVIRFNRFSTTKSHIQGAGRARRSDAKIFYFDNDPHEEEGRARLLAVVAKDDSLRLTEAERSERRQEATFAVEGVYPFYPPNAGTKAEVNLYNCLQMVYEYCAKTMGQSLNPEDLFTYDEKVICDYPRQVRKFITEVKYPSPEGFLKVTLEKVNGRWGDTKLETVLDPNRSKNMKQDDKDKRRFLYVVAIEMHERGLLDGNNQPSGKAVHGNKLACEAFTMNPGLRLSTASYGKPAPAQTAATPSPSPTPAAPAPLLEENFKSRLNEWATKKWRQPAPELLKYDSETTSLGFVATVQLLKTGLEFKGTAHPKKKDAEQSAAAAALAILA